VLLNADLSAAQLSDANMSRAYLWGANLEGAQLTRAELVGADLANTNIVAADFTNADLTRVHSGQISGDPSVLPQPWKLASGWLLGPTANLEWANLAGIDFGSADLTKANLYGAGLYGARLGATTLTGVMSGWVVGEPQDLPLNWQFIHGNLIGPGADLTGADLTNLDLRLSHLEGVKSGWISGTPSALPTGWHLMNRYLIGPGADLTNADLSRLPLNFSLRNTVLTGANVDGTNFYGADLSGVRSGGIHGDPSLDRGWELYNGYLIGPGADLRSATLSGLSAPLTTESWILTNADFSGADLVGANLASADLRWSNLTQANLTGANLAGADLLGSDVSGATFTGATLKYIHGAGLTGAPAALPPEWKTASGYLIGPGADLRVSHLTQEDLQGASLRGSDLSWADLSHLDLSGIDMSSAVLVGTNLSNTMLERANLFRLHTLGIQTTPANLPASWKQISGYLLGPSADLTGAQLVNADLTNTNLADVLLRGARLAGAVLTGADVRGTDFSFADLTNVDLTGLDVSGSNMAGATLIDANMSGVNLGEVNMSKSLLVRTNLSAADMAHADLSSVYSSEVRGTPASLPASWQIVHGIIMGPGATFDGANLSGTSVSGVSLKGARAEVALFVGAVLTDVDLAGADLKNSNFAHANFQSVDLTDADLTGANLAGVRWSNTICTDGTNSDSHNGSSCLAPLDSVAPATTLTMNAPAFTTSLVHRIGVAWSANDGNGSGIASYDVRYSKTSVVSIATPVWKAWQVSTKAASATITLASGYGYCFQSRARDAAGNTGAWGAQRCTNTAIDDHDLGASDGWRRGSRSATFANTLTVTTAIGATLSKPSSYISQVGLLATACPTCGTVDVYIGARKLGSVSLYASATKFGKVFMLPKLANRQQGTLKLVTVRSAIPGRNHVTIDGVLASA
jgi:uncharacterized protein YjbI with pentapeptide repeats